MKDHGSIKRQAVAEDVGVVAGWGYASDTSCFVRIEVGSVSTYLLAPPLWASAIASKYADQSVKVSELMGHLCGHMKVPV